MSLDTVQVLLYLRLMNERKGRDPALEKLFQERGMQRRISAGLGITASAVQQWKRIPAERVIDVSRVTGVPPWVLRPDLYALEKIA